MMQPDLGDPENQRAQSRFSRIVRVFRSGSLRSVVARNMSVALIVRLLSLLVGLLTQLALARSLGVEEFGAYTFVWAIFLSCAIVSTWGFSLSSIRFVSIYHSQQEWPLLRGFNIFGRMAVVCMSLVVAMVSAMILYGLIRIELVAPSLGYTISIALIMLPLYSLFDIQTGILRGANQLMAALISRNILFNLFLSGLVLATLPFIDRLNANWTVLISGASLILALLVQQYCIIRSLPSEFRQAPAQYHMREWFTVSGTLMASIGLEQFMRQAEILIVGGLIGTTASGIYAVASRFARLINAGLFISNQSTAHMYPVLYTENRTADIQSVVSFTTLVTVVTTVPMILIMFTWPQEILTWFGSEFAADGTMIFQILLIGQLVNTVSGPNAVLLQMTQHEVDLVHILTVTFLLQLALFGLFAVQFGMVGVAIATSVVMTIRNVAVSLRVLQRVHVNTTFFSRHVWRSALQMVKT